MGRMPDTLSRSVERYGLGYIRPRHNEIARRLVMGQNQVTIALAMGLDQGRLSIIVNSPLFKVVLAKLSKLRDEQAVDIQEEIKELVPIALDNIAKTVMTSPSENLRLSASQDILDRGGVVKKTAHSPSLGVQINIHPVDLEKYRGDSKGNGNGDGVTIDVTEESSAVQPVNTSKSNGGSEEVEESMKLLDEALKEIEKESDVD